MRWYAACCRRRAAESRFVRCATTTATPGRSSTIRAGQPTSPDGDLALDPLRLLDAIGAGPAPTWSALAAGGGIAQRLALTHAGAAERLLTLNDTSPVTATARGELPLPAPALLRTFEDPEPAPDWSDRDAVIDYRVAIERP